MFHIAGARRWRELDESGFTLIELLVVILIVGILAAIAIPLYMNQRNAAVTASVKSNASELTKALNLVYVKNGTLPRQGPLASDGIQTPGMPEKILNTGKAVTMHPLNADGTTFIETEYGPWMRNDVFGYRAFRFDPSTGIYASCWAENHVCTAAALYYKDGDGAFHADLVGDPKCKLNTTADNVICS